MFVNPMSLTVPLFVKYLVGLTSEGIESCTFYDIRESSIKYIHLQSHPDRIGRGHLPGFVQQDGYIMGSSVSKEFEVEPHGVLHSCHVSENDFLEIIAVLRSGSGYYERSLLWHIGKCSP